MSISAADAIRRAATELAVAHGAAIAWCDDERARAEVRLGVDAGSDAVLDDPAYLRALDVLPALGKLRDHADEVAREIAKAEGMPA